VARAGSLWLDLIDVEHAIIVDVEATPARTYDEVAASSTMIERTRRRFKLSPRRLAADTAYGISRFLAFVTGAGIIPYGRHSGRDLRPEQPR
jgi:hypothetical protein